MRAGRLARDPIDVLERAYDLSGDEHTWLQRVTESMGRFSGFEGFSFVFDVRGPTIVRPDGFVSYLPESDFRTAIRALQSTNDGFLASRVAQDAVFGKTMCETLAHISAGRASRDGLEPLFELQSWWAPRDVLGIIGRNPDGTGIGFSATLPSGWRLPEPFVRQGTRIATHLAAALRLRRSLSARPSGHDYDDEEGIIDASSRRLAHAVGPAREEAARRALHAAVRAVDRARGKLRTEDPIAATELWQGLVAGRWSLIERYESDGRRYYVAHRNDPQVSEPRALNARERQVIAYAVQGHSNKVIAYSLGIALSTVASHLASAQKKLGVRSRTELVRLASLLQGRPKRSSP
jgi:DNA-binding CsgD family transcriptional regulator